MDVGQKLNVTVEKLSLGGDGIVRLSNGPSGDGRYVLFVPYSVPGDELEIEITKLRKTFGRAKISQILKPGPHRITPPCGLFFDSLKRPESFCGGCDMQQLSFSAQVDTKVLALKEALSKIAGISPEVVPALMAASGDDFRYRNKVQVPFSKDLKTGKVIAGFYSPGSHDIVPFEDCLIHSKEMGALVNFTVAHMNDWKLEPYSEKLMKGWLRHIVIRQSLADGKMGVIFVTNQDFFQKRNEWVSEIKKSFPFVTGIIQNVNSESTNVILGKKWKTVWGENFLMEQAGNIRLKVSAGSFFQVNSRMAESLYTLARDWAGSGKTLLDLYCGVGGIGILSAPSFEQVFGADNSSSSISDAQQNIKINNVSNCRFFVKDVHAFLHDYSRRTIGEAPPDTVVLDPPRAGCSPEVLDRLIKLGPSRIIYVSCDPGTLARDLKILGLQGYRVIKVAPVDLFPQSSHIESVTLLQK